MSILESRTVKIHQILHGYQDGHALIQSSVKLSNSSRRKMLVLSDMSGPTMTHGFESYVTAYPLPDDNFYVLARTWYAPEMERPGCVWTHSLLIEMADVAQIGKLTVLMNKFRRPQKGLPTEYERSIPIIGEEIASSSQQWPEDLRSQSTPIVEALYDEPNRPVIIAADNADQYEAIVAQIWSQQWPRLRRNFTFCTGSTSFRHIGSDPFDLQVVPRHWCHRIRRGSPQSIVVDESHRGDISTWLTEAVIDLVSDLSTPYRKFLWDYGVDISAGRACFKPLTTIYIELKHRENERPDLQNVAHILSSYFPLPTEGKRLKSALFGFQERLSAGLLRNESEGNILRELVSMEDTPAFDAESLSIRQRAKRLWKSDRLAAHEITLSLLHGDVKTFGEQFVRGIIETMETADAVEFIKKEPGLLSFFVKLNPMLAAAPSVWDCHLSKQRELVDALISIQPIEPNILAQITRTMMQKADDAIAEEVVAGLGEGVVSFVLEQLHEIMYYPQSG